MLGFFLLLQSPVVAAAQPSSASSVLEPCSVVAQGEAGAVRRIYAGCADRAVWLGSATDYKSSYNPVLKSLIVVTTMQGSQKVRVVTSQPGGSLQVDDFTRDLTKLSGRFPDFGLVSPVDISTFAVDGIVSVQAAVTNLPESGSESADRLATPTASAALKPFDVRPFINAGN